MRTKSKSKKPEEQYVEPEKAPDPTIPNKILKEFLDRHVSVGDAVNVTKIKDGFLWQKGDIERYRVNVWMRRDVEGQYCHDNYIGYSWFLHFNRKDEVLTDKTLGEVVENKNKVKKLEGIADNNVRVGKSPW